jgi:hypothetical protein
LDRNPQPVSTSSDSSVTLLSSSLGFFIGFPQCVSGCVYGSNQSCFLGSGLGVETLNFGLLSFLFDVPAIPIPATKRQQQGNQAGE